MVAISRRSRRANNAAPNPCLLAVVALNGLLVVYLTLSSLWYESTDQDTRDAWKPSTPSSSLFESDNDDSLSMTVDYIPFENIPEREDAYAGGWWQTSERFLKMDLDPIDDRIHPSFDAWIDGRGRELRLTTDWLTFSVEHLSKWWKITDWPNNLNAYHVLVTQLLAHVRREMQQARETENDPQMQQHTTTMQQTLGVIATSPYLEEEQLSKSRVLSTLNLASTVASLLRVRMGRVVVSCDKRDIKETVGIFYAMHKVYSEPTTTIDQLEDFLTTYQYDEKIPNRETFSLEFQIGYTEVALVTVPCTEERGTYIEDEPQVPKATLLGLRQALLRYGSDPTSFSRKWLGKRADTIQTTTTSTTTGYFLWTYVYMTEPDTLLHARIADLPALGKTLQQGNVLVPHRLQPIPHVADLPNIPQQLVVPAVGNFSNIMTLSAEKDACCDINYHPAWHQKLCRHMTWNLWFRCGFHSADNAVKKNRTLNAKVIARGHQRLALYDMIRLTDGSQLVHVAANNNARRCVPKIGGNCPRIPPADKFETTV